jgi:hypothetical protein
LSVDAKVSSLKAPPTTEVRVTPVESKKDLDEFIALPYRLYADDPLWVAPLRYLEKQRFSAKHNRFYAHADVQLFVARRGDEVVGRISAHIDHEHNKYHRETTGFWGFFECVEDPEVAKELLRTAEQWLAVRGMTLSRGPLNFSVNGEVGFLQDGFDLAPMPLMTYNPPYYLALVEGAGYGTAKDLFAWRWERVSIPDGPPRRMVDELRARPDITIRRARMKDFRKEVDIILSLYNDAWSENWGMVPATRAEADQMSSELKLIVDPAIVPIVEVNGVPVGMALAVPNFNWAMQPLRGNLFPFGWLRFLWRLKVRRPDSGRLMLLGVKKEYRTREYAGLAYLLCDEIYRAANDRGYNWAEFSWTLEDNGLINSLIKKIGCEHYKTYRIYEKPLP